MATITTFSTLKTAVADFLGRSDMSAVGGPIDVMIALAEDKIYRELRLRFMEDSTAVAISSGVVPIPGDYMELRNATVTNSGEQTSLDAKSADWHYANYPLRSTDGVPKFIGQEGDNFIFSPYPDNGYTVTVRYYAKPTRLSTSNETNWLTSNATDLLFYEALLQSIAYLGSDERAPMWKAERDRSLLELQQQQKRARYGWEQSLGPM
jgi:hypothetical protein